MIGKNNKFICHRCLATMLWSFLSLSFFMLYVRLHKLYGQAINQATQSGHRQNLIYSGWMLDESKVLSIVFALIALFLLFHKHEERGILSRILTLSFLYPALYLIPFVT